MTRARGGCDHSARMLVIRAAQMNAFAESLTQRFDRDFQLFIMQRLPHAEARHGDVLPAKIEAGLARASKHGIDDFNHLLLFVGMELLVNERYFERDENAWIRPLLDDPELDGGAKMELIRSRLEARDAIPAELAALLSEKR